MKKSQTILMYVGIFCIVFLCVFGCFKTVYELNHYVDDSQLKEAELKYWHTKAELANEVDNYITSVAPTSNLSGAILVEKCLEYDVDVKLALAQGHQESHFGTQGLATKTNSVWNVGAFDSLTYAQIHKKHICSNPNESIEKYLKVLTEQYLTGSKSEKDLLENFVTTTGKRYASSPIYERLLKDKYDQISNDTKIDSLQKELRHWTIQANRDY